MIEDDVIQNRSMSDPTFSDIDLKKWFWSELPLNMNSSLENTESGNERMDIRLLLDLEVNTVDDLRDHYKFSRSETRNTFGPIAFLYVILKVLKLVDASNLVKPGQTWLVSLSKITAFATVLIFLSTTESTV